MLGKSSWQLGTSTCRRRVRLNPPFLRSHVWIPLAIFSTTFGVIEVLSLDPVVARALYFDPISADWLGAGSGSWWARDVLHTGGRWLIRLIAAAAIVTWALSFAFTRMREWRWPAGYAAAAMLVATVTVGVLKAMTNVDCPWDLLGFGGQNPYVPLFADRPDWLPRAQCFPGAHASSGFALMCFYFVFRDRQRRMARWALAAAITIGVAFSIGQEARGAHFISHDLTSAALVWFIQLALYGWMLAPRAAARANSPFSVNRAASSSGSSLM